jgi:hypothetical protein
MVWGHLVNLSSLEASTVAGLWWRDEATNDSAEPKTEWGEDQGGARDEMSRRVRIQSQRNKNPVSENPKPGNHLVEPVRRPWREVPTVVGYLW